MAIDTRERRQAVSSLKRRRTATVTPSASPGQAWRQEVGWGYPGILADAPVAAATVQGTMTVAITDTGTMTVAFSDTGTMAVVVTDTGSMEVTFT